MLKEFIFYDEALPYILLELKQGMSLAKALYYRVGKFDGTAKAFLPESSELIERVTFMHGIFPGPADDQPIIEFISDYLSKAKNRIAVFENYTYSPNHFEDNKYSNVIFNKEEVYEYLTHRDESITAVSQVYYRKSNYPSIGVLSELPSNLILPKGEYVNKSLLEEISNHSDHILIGAYDDETMLIWTFGESLDTLARKAN
jgi:hypothetical protein